jgi:hypothetical protein
MYFSVDENTIPVLVLGLPKLLPVALEFEPSAPLLPSSLGFSLPPQSFQYR